MAEDYVSDPRLRRFARDHGLSADAIRQLATLLSGLVAERGHTAATAGVLDALAEPTRAPEAGDRYVDLGRIGAGATGDVRRVRDRAMGRDVAMKVLHRALLPHAGALARFRREAAFTALLEHPGVVVVHDQGTLPDGRPWFTMQEVRGATLRVASREWSLHRRIDAFARVCQTVAYAHDRGVVHRDLKPDNVMVGSFGEVRVMDWGLAARIGEGAPKEEELPVLPGLTRVGAVLGTPGYQSPEVLAGVTGSPAADVWALGAILHTLLAGGPPTDPPAVDDAPEELATLCVRTLAADPAARPTAAVLADEALAWLEGARRRAQAEALLARVDERLPQLQALQDAGAAALAAADVARRGAPEVRRTGWRLEAQAAERARAGALAEAEVERELHAALNLDPDHVELHARLADLYRDRQERAEARRDTEGAAVAEVLLRAHDRGRHAAWLSGEGTLSLDTVPTGARVTLFPWIEVDRRLVPGPAHPLGETPLRAVRVPHGAHLLVVEAPGFSPMRLPILLPRLGAWTSPPLPLVPAGVTDACYVPAGWFQCGGDPDAADHLPARRVWVEGFVIGRYPVTHGEWLAFVNAEHAAGRDVSDLLPRTKVDLKPIYRFTDRWEAGPDDRGDLWTADLPITQITWLAARRYCAALPPLFGQRWRLPDEVEWEKAARGVDGRVWPWGHHFEPAVINTANGPGQPHRAAVTAFPDDESPYGVRGLAGNVRDLCANAWSLDGDLPEGPLVPREALPDEARIVLRGGNWYSAPSFCRPANRLVGRPDDRISGVGFRVCAGFSGVRH